MFRNQGETPARGELFALHVMGLIFPSPFYSKKAILPSYCCCRNNLPTSAKGEITLLGLPHDSCIVTPYLFTLTTHAIVPLGFVKRFHSWNTWNGPWLDHVLVVSDRYLWPNISSTCCVSILFVLRAVNSYVKLQEPDQGI